eukprot:TRINITY_DN5918_c0_g1_i8.p1 TRINITY_DN5918_c0_g1~~TRINITY_DN5918_c0_g1_i8.p1  ORF type:complete len:292 (-),score=57.70 TRINITY_DN5918_c0_g1_i8:90-965(-)
MAYQKVLRITREFVGYRLFCQSWKELTEFCDLWCGGVSIPLMVYLIGQGAKVAKRIVASGDRISSRKSLLISNETEGEGKDKENEDDVEGASQSHQCTLSNASCSPGKTHLCMRLREQVLTCFFEELRAVKRQQQQDEVTVPDTKAIRLCDAHYSILLKFTETQQNTNQQGRKITVNTSAGGVNSKKRPGVKMAPPRLSNVLVLQSATLHDGVISTPKDIVALTWFFLAKVAAVDELFTSGVIRIDDPDAKFFNFLDACEGVYERRSTHYPERLDETFFVEPGCSKRIRHP